MVPVIQMKIMIVLTISVCSSLSGSKSANVLAVLGSVAADVLDLTGFYYGGKALLPKRKLQQSFISTTPA